MNKTLVRQVLPILIAVGLLWYVLKDIPFTALAAQFRQANFGWLIPACLLIGLSHLVRASRWQLTLQALGYRPSLFHTVVALLAGSLASMLIPGAGELTRCGTLQRTDGVPIAKGIGSVVAERIIDLLMLGVLVTLTFLIEFNRVGEYLIHLLSPSSTYTAPGRNSGLIFFIALLMGGVLIGGYWLLRFTALQQQPFFRRLSAVGRDIGKGIMGIRQLKRPGLFISLTLLSYGLIFLATYVLFFAASHALPLPPTAALTILTVSSLGGIAVPTQGGLGTFHFLVSRVLLLYGLSETEGVVVATFIHAVGFGMNLLLSSISFLVVPTLITTKPPTSTTSIIK